MNFDLPDFDPAREGLKIALEQKGKALEDANWPGNPLHGRIYPVDDRRKGQDLDFASSRTSLIKSARWLMIRARRNLPMPKRSNAFAKFRHCGCLSCQIITLVLDQQAESHGTKWRPSEVMHALSEASALFCNELIAHFGDAAFAESGWTGRAPPRPRAREDRHPAAWARINRKQGARARDRPLIRNKSPTNCRVISCADRRAQSSLPNI